MGQVTIEKDKRTGFRAVHSLVKFNDNNTNIMSFISYQSCTAKVDLNLVPWEVIGQTMFAGTWRVSFNALILIGEGI